ncbi:unnamed protein product, partial [Didymodactylos carnosus]
EIVPLSRLLQTPTLDFGTDNRYVDTLLQTFEKGKIDDLFVTPSIQRHSVTALRKNQITITDLEEYYRDHVYIPFLTELVDNIKNRLPGMRSPRIVLLTILRSELMRTEKTSQPNTQLADKFVYQCRLHQLNDVLLPELV